MSVNDKISKEKGQKEGCPSDTIFIFVATDDYVLVETEGKEYKYLEENGEPVKDLEQLSCEICESKFKSSTNLKRHDQRFHLKQGSDNEFKCDFCKEISAEKEIFMIILEISIINALFVQKYFQLPNH